MDSSDLVGAVWLPNDAKANPSDITQDLARGAREKGVQILERSKVTGFGVDRDRVTCVRTARGDIECEIVVNCGGQWAKALAEQVGVTVPLYSAEHYYGELHPGPQLHHGHATGTGELLRRGRLQLIRDRVCRRGGPGGSSPAP